MESKVSSSGHGVHHTDAGKPLDTMRMQVHLLAEEHTIPGQFQVHSARQTYLPLEKRQRQSGSWCRSNCGVLIRRRLQDPMVYDLLSAQHDFQTNHISRTAEIKLKGTEVEIY